MNPRLGLLQPYAFEKLRALMAGVSPPPGLRHINLSIGEPQHATPALIKDALTANLATLARYPVTKGLPELRTAIAEWLARRHDLASIDAETQVLPVLGSREAIFSIAQTVLDPMERDALVVCPNPFYQIYEGATLLGGATPYFVNAFSASDFRSDWDAVPAEVWKRARLLYACSPGNPNGRVMPREEWRKLFELSDRYGFVIVSDECYSEIYFDEASPPPGALGVARTLGRDGYPRLIVMGSLSKRSNAPGLRSGFAAGDASLMERFHAYRTYHGCAMSNAVQHASIAAWKDEGHVKENRRLYREKFETFHAIVDPVLPLAKPQAAFYFWAAVPGDDTTFARELLAATNMTVLPGSLMSREAHGANPGRGFVRMALVSTVEETVEAAHRLRDFMKARVRGDAGKLVSDEMRT